MDIASIIEALRALQESDAPTSKTAIVEMLKPLQGNALEPLREWVDSINDNLSNAEDAATTLTEAAREDRDDAHDTLIGDVGALLDDLSPVAPATRDTSTDR